MINSVYADKQTNYCCFTKFNRLILCRVAGGAGAYPS